MGMLMRQSLQLDAYYLNWERTGWISQCNMPSRRQLNEAEKNYMTTEREGLGMVHAIKSLDTIYLPTSLCSSSVALLDEKTMQHW